MKKICDKYPECFLNSRLNKIPATSKTRKIELVAFDMDGVLVDIRSSWQYIHDYFKVNNRKSVISYIKGEIDYLEFIKRDANLWTKNGKPVSINLLKEILSTAPLMKGAEECIKVLKNKGINTCIISAGLDLLAERISNDLGIDHFFANGIGTDEKNLFNGEGNLRVELLGKDKIIIDISKKFGINLENIASVGNSCFDIPMLKISGLGIAFNPDDECIKEAADYVIKDKDLTKIYQFLNLYI